MEGKPSTTNASKPKVKNKAPAAVQITAEQILREAFERQEATLQRPKQQITDADELEEYRLRKRKGFEDRIKMNRTAIGTWFKYAHWEESQREFARARSIFERVLDEDYTNTTIWIKYAELEMRNKNVNHARNIWDRAVTLLPRVSSFWYKYIFMEDQMGNYAGARQIFERWMEWQPDMHSWNAYIKFEKKCGELDRVRMIYERYIIVHPIVKTWVFYAKFEEACLKTGKARNIYERAIEYLGEDANDERLFIAFAKFEERQKETERARAIFKYALDHIPKSSAKKLYQMFISFEKQNGDREGIEDVIVSKKRFQYEEEIKLNSNNYDMWFDYIRLEESYGNLEKATELYERALACKPPLLEKQYWQRYIYFWINYGIFTELSVRNIEKTRQIYKECLNQIPLKKFSFSRIWIMYSEFELRQKNLEGARKILGNALGVSPKENIFKHYIQLELQLGNMDRCRTLYEKYIQFSPSSCSGWIAFAEMERDLAEFDRSRSIFELAIKQPILDTPAILWKSYIDFEIQNDEIDRARDLYQRLLDKTKHEKVWTSFAKFEFSHGNISTARKIFQDAEDHFKENDMVEERVLLIDSWKEFEEDIGDDNEIEKIKKKVPTKHKRKRPIDVGENQQDLNNDEIQYEFYYEYYFPGDDTSKSNLKLLQMAHKWKKQKTSE